ncbi:unnamed protein product [Rhizophagus irregularis]|nr:unnamed protein product [Rhizophagus irregularis]
MSNKEYNNIRLLGATKFPLASGWATKEAQKYGKKDEECFLVGNVDKSYRMTAQDMWDLLTLKAQEGEIESSDIPKVTTIQGWITHYAAQLHEKSAQTML